MAGRQLQHAAGLGLIHLAVAQEGPGVLLGGVLDVRALEVLVEPGLVDGLGGAQPHGDGGVLPEVLHAAGVRVGGQTPAAGGAGLLLAEAVQVGLPQAPLDEGSGVVAGRGVALEEDVVAAAGVVLAAEEVVEAHLIQGGGRRVGGDMATDSDAGALRPGHHDGGVPAQPAPIGPLGVLVAGEVWFVGDVDGVDVRRRHLGGHRDVLLPGLGQHAQQDVARTLGALVRDEGIEGLVPLLGLLWVVVGHLRQEAVNERRGVTGGAHGILFPRVCAVGPSLIACRGAEGGVGVRLKSGHCG